MRGLSTGDSSFNAVNSRMTTEASRTGAATSMGKAGEEAKRALLEKVAPSGQAGAPAGSEDYADGLLTKKRAQDRRKA